MLRRIVIMATGLTSLLHPLALLLLYLVRYRLPTATTQFRGLCLPLPRLFPCL